MITRTYIDRFNTIIHGSDINVGISPVAILEYGNDDRTRLLIHFSEEKLRRMHEEGDYPDLSKFRHTLKVRNCGSIDMSTFFAPHMDMVSNNVRNMKASSFDMVFLEMPCEWDGGNGYDFKFGFTDLYGHWGITRTDGANWNSPRTGMLWEDFGENLVPGVFSTETISDELEKYRKGEKSIVIGVQRFNVGSENIDVDITDAVNRWIAEGGNHGICAVFSPVIEETITDIPRYISFFTHKTQNFYEPYLESVYDDAISDDRADFVLGKKNRIYLYSNIGGSFENLDETPKCTVGDIEFPVVRQFRGVYYVEVTLPATMKPNTMVFDKWSNIRYGGTALPDIEMDFTTRHPHAYFNIGAKVDRKHRYVPQVSGISDNETIMRNGDVRKVEVYARVPYTRVACEVLENIEYRVYSKQGEREIEVIPYQKCHRSFLENYFYLDFSEFVPGDYCVDIRTKYDGETITHTQVSRFTVASEVTRK